MTFTFYLYRYIKPVSGCSNLERSAGGVDLHKGELPERRQQPHAQSPLQRGVAIIVLRVDTQLSVHSVVHVVVEIEAERVVRQETATQRTTVQLDRHRLTSCRHRGVGQLYHTGPGNNCNNSSSKPGRCVTGVTMLDIYTGARQ